MTRGRGEQAELRFELVDDIEAITTDWDRLADRTDAPPFLRAGWALRWAESFAPGRLRALTAWRADELAGVLTLVVTGRQAASAANGHTPFSDLLAADGEAAAAIARRLLEPGRFRRVDLQHLSCEGRGWPALTAAAAAGSRPRLAWIPVRSPYVALEGDWESFQAGLPAMLRKNMRRRERQLDELGAVRLEVPDEGEQLDRLLSEGFELESSGWKRAQGTAITSEPRVERFYRAIAEWAAARGTLRLFFLRSGERSVAFDMGLCDGGRLYVLKGGFDPAFARFSPGQLLIWQVLQWGFATGLSRYELLGADDPYKLRWTSDVHAAARLQVFSRSPCGAGEWTAGRFGRPLVRRLRRQPATPWVSL